MNNYTSTLEKELENSSNPIIALIDSIPTEKENETEKKWERVAAFTALGNAFSSIGNTIAAKSGVEPSEIDYSYMDRAMKQIEESKERQRDDYEKRYQEQLSKSIRLENRQNEIDDNLLDYNSKIYESNNDFSLAEKKLETSLLSDLMREEYSLSRASTPTSSKAKSNTTSTSAPIRKAKKVVYNSKGEKVELMEEDITKLYLLGKEYGIASTFENSKNETTRQIEFDLLIQQAYLLYERDQLKLKLK